MRLKRTIKFTIKKYQQLSDVQKYGGILSEEAKDQFEIWINHKNLEYFMKAQKLNQRQAKWVLYLLRFNFALKYVAGKSMGQADSLSRLGRESRER